MRFFSRDQVPRISIWTNGTGSVFKLRYYPLTALCHSIVYNNYNPLLIYQRLWQHLGIWYTQIYAALSAKDISSTQEDNWQTLRVQFLKMLTDTENSFSPVVMFFTNNLDIPPSWGKRYISRGALLKIKTLSELYLGNRCQRLVWTP